MTHRFAFTTAALCLIASLATTVVPVSPALAQTKSAKVKEEPKPPFLQGQCYWTGTRVLHALLREDTIAANDHLGFYEKFKCPGDRIPQAFACAVDAPVGAARPKNDILVKNCWETLTPNRESEVEANANAAAKPERKQAK
ncbi:hypothetical protein [Iodidimonas sp. SYSU 1G8]|uniref:hypothetical protein n=1 Tax=Iodidimonas sp. SYSU 1G8 TaxID=3133967 RepID=UPI0031FE5B16